MNAIIAAFFGWSGERSPTGFPGGFRYVRLTKSYIQVRASVPHQGQSQTFFERGVANIICYNAYMQVKDIEAKALPILKRRSVKRASVFGSTARGELGARDVDMLVEMTRPYGLFSFLSLKNELEEALGEKVDLITYDTIKPALRENILRDEVAIL